MNHPKGEESTGVGDPCSSRTTCPQSSVLRRSEPRQTAVLRPGRTFKERNLCGGFRSFLFLAEPAVPPRGYGGKAGLSPALPRTKGRRALVTDSAVRLPLSPLRVP